MSHEIDRLLGQQGRLPRRRSRVPVWLLVLVIIAALGLVAAAYYFLRPLDAPVPAGAGELAANLEQTTTEEGFPSLGSPAAPTVVEVFSSFACPHCREFADEHFPGLVSGIAAGQIRFVFIPVAHIGPGAGDAARAALCAGEQGRFWEMHDTLFHWQDRYLTQVFAARRLEQGAENLGLDLAAFKQCVDSSRPQAVIDRARQQFDARSLRGTPTIFVNGERLDDYNQLEPLGDAP